MHPLLDDEDERCQNILISGEICPEARSKKQILQTDWQFLFWMHKKGKVHHEFATRGEISKACFAILQNSKDFLFKIGMWSSNINISDFTSLIYCEL